MKFFLIKCYCPLNFTLLGLSIYAITFPLTSFFLEHIYPHLNKCAYKELTGNDCPLCGGTRFFSDILTNGLTLNHLTSIFGFFFIILLLEFISRIILIIKNKKLTKKIFIIDLIWHLFILLSYIIYLITFFIF